MATVYLAIQENFQREVALKVMSPALADDSDFSERFLREAQIVSHLVHPNIVTVHDVGIENGHHYLSMEYVGGKELKECLPSLTGEELFRVVEEVAKALDYAGKKGYVHRDVKPENIMLHDLDGRAVLMDFGIARATDAASSVTRTGIALGTPHYMSPEQARGSAVDGRSDLYSLGVLLYYMLVGKVPFDADSPVAIGIKHISAAIPRLPVALADYQSLVDRLMAKKPEDRYQTGEELIHDLAGIDVAAVNRWRAKRGFVTLDEREDTPLRSDAITLEVDTSELDQALDKEPNITVAAMPANDPSPSEALHIPREDLDARVVEPSGSHWFVNMLLLMMIAAAPGFYYYEQILILVPKPLAELLPGYEAPSSVVVIEPSRVVESLIAVEPKAVQQQLLAEGVESEVGPGQESIDMITSTTHPLDELLKQSQGLAALVQEQPERTGELLGLYHEILTLHAENPQAIQAIVDLKAHQLTVVAGQIDSGETAAAQQHLITTLGWFPELETDTLYQQLEERVQVTIQVNTLLAQAEEFLLTDRLVLPAEANAKERFISVLALAPNNKKAQQGLEKISDRYTVLALAAQQEKDYQTAQALVKNGLSVNSGNQKLLDLREILIVNIQQEQKIKQLLVDALNLEQQQHWFGKGDSAAQRYQAVLAIEPQRIEADRGLTRILENLYSQVDNLIAGKDYTEAGEQIQSALFSFTDNDRLLSLLLKLESFKPVIENLLLSGDTIANAADDNTSPAETIALDRTLHIAFRYRNLDQPTTVLQALLFDGGRSIQIAAAPVVVVGNEGITQFRIDRPVEGFAAGGYHLDVMLAGQRIFTHAFVIKN